MTDNKREYSRKATWSPKFRKCRMCKLDIVEHYGGGYCLDCYPKSKESIILQKYLEGNNLAEIGLELRLSRERIRQLFSKTIDIEFARLGSDLSQTQKYDIKNTVELTYKQARATRDYKQYIDKNYEYITETLGTEIILSEAGMLKALGLPASAMHLIEEEYPEFLELISENRNRWSWKYDKCRKCGTTAVKHKRWGYCEKCYTKSDEWKEQQYKYRSTHYEQFREKQKAYASEYYKRPEVKKRLTEYSYQRRYEGNREVALNRDGYSCMDCGMTREEHFLKYKLDLGVFHADGNLENNELSNLITLCKACLAKRTRTIKLSEENEDE